MKLSWLWFLPVLFIDSIFCYPLLVWTVRRSKKIPFDVKCDSGVIILQVLILIAWAAIEVQVLGRDEGYRLLLPSTGVFALYLIFLYSYQKLLNIRKGWRYALFLKLLGPIASICLNFFKRPTPGPDIYGFLMMVHYHGIFMS